MDGRTLIQEELDQGEELLWWGAPSPERVAQQEKATGGAGIFAAVFGVFWLCGVLFIGGSAAQAGAPAVFPIFAGGMFLFGLFFVAKALGIAGTPAREAEAARRTIYAVTDKRLIVLVQGQGARSFTPRDIERVERRDLPDGRGDVLFARERRLDFVGHNRHHAAPDRWKELGFFGIENPREVERLIRAHLLQ